MIFITNIVLYITMCTLSVSNVIYHKFSHGAAFYMLNWKNVNVMLEYTLRVLLMNMGLVGWCVGPG